MLAKHGLDLHPHVRWFWMSWPVAASEIVHPGFTGVGFAADVLERDESPMPFLLPIGYGSHQDLLVDLIPDDGGPNIYVFDYFDDTGIRPVFRGFADLLRYLITFFEDERAADRSDRPFDLVNRRDQLATLLPPTMSDDETRPVTIDIDSWPSRWRTHLGLDEHAAAPRGATHTVAELIAARQHGPVRATVVGRLQAVGDSGGTTLARLSDQTGSVEVRINTDARRYGRSPTDTYEVELVADRQVGPERTIDDFSEGRAEASRHASASDFLQSMRAARDMVLRGLGDHVTGNRTIRVLAQRPIR